MDPTAAEVNNAGVSHLEDGDVCKALACFRDALRQIMGAGIPGQPPAANNATGARATFAFSPESLPRSSTSYMHATETTASVSQTKPSQPDLSFLYAQGFCVVATPGAYSPDPMTNTTVVAALIVFNLAVVYHIKGILVKGLGDAHLVKSYNLYERSQQLVRDMGVTIEYTGNAVVDLLFMAVANNLAHVCHERNDYVEARVRFDALIRFALTVVPARYGDEYVTSVMETQKSNFLLNTIILQAPSSAQAA